MKRILLLGDSILKGIQVSLGSGRYQVENHMDLKGVGDRYGLCIENGSRFGCTVEKGRQLIFRALEKGETGDVIVMDFGGNDSDFDWKAVAAEPDADHAPHTPLPAFTAAYRDILVTLRAHNVTPVVTTLPPVLADRYLSWICRDGLSRDSILHWLGTPETIYRYQENYSRAVERLARETETPLVDLRGAFLARRRIDGLYCADGIHPNTLGQLLIQDTFEQYLKAHAVA